MVNRRAQINQDNKKINVGNNLGNEEDVFSPWDCSSGWSGHWTQNKGDDAGREPRTPTGSSLWSCDPQTHRRIYESATRKKTKKSLYCCSIHRKMKTSNRSSSSTLTTRSKALTVRSPEQVYSSPLWICMAFTASWWPSNTPSVGRSSSPWSDDASVKPNTQKYQYEHTNKELFVWYKLKLHLILSFWSPEYLKLNTSVKYALCIFSGWSGYS